MSLALAAVTSASVLLGVAECSASGLYPLLRLLHLQLQRRLIQDDERLSLLDDIAFRRCDLHHPSGDHGSHLVLLRFH